MTDLDDFVAADQTAYAAAQSGLCSCGQPGCSDAGLRESVLPDTKHAASSIQEMADPYREAQAESTERDVETLAELVLPCCCDSREKRDWPHIAQAQAVKVARRVVASEWLAQRDATQQAKGAEAGATDGLGSVERMLFGTWRGYAEHLETLGRDKTIRAAMAQGAHLVLAAVEMHHSGTHSCGIGSWYTDDPDHAGDIAERKPCPTLAAARAAVEQIGGEQCPGDPCPDDCARCGSGDWSLTCDDCRFYAAQDGETDD